MNERWDCWMRHVPFDQKKPIFPTLPCHFSWRDSRKMVFSAKLAPVLTMSRVQTVSLWMLRKKAAKVPPLMPEVLTVWGMVSLSGEAFGNASSQFPLVVTQCVLVHMFSVIKVRFQLHKLQKRYIYHFWLFLGTSSSALSISLSTCKNERNAI